ncbi:MAG: hypothetical protein J0M08_04975 [Bacteroidetes bacterium]|nr:hypothetical protein [Bacteroidota bacterium]
MAEYRFPQYRKYLNGKSYFKIMSNKEFEEVQLIGNKKIKHSIQAKILPDFNYINDMLQCLDGHWVEIEEQEYFRITDYFPR